VNRWPRSRKPGEEEELKRGASACRRRHGERERDKGRHSSEHNAPETPASPSGPLIPCCYRTPPETFSLTQTHTDTHTHTHTHLTDPLWRHSNTFKTSPRTSQKLTSCFKALHLSSLQDLQRWTHFSFNSLSLSFSLSPSFSLALSLCLSLSLLHTHTVCLSFTARRSHKQIGFLPPTNPGLSSVCVCVCVCVCVYVCVCVCVT